MLPKGVIREKQLPNDVALERVFKEAGIKARIISPAGETSYEFYSITRRSRVCNKITWNVMQSDSPRLPHRLRTRLLLTAITTPSKKALELVTYSQDKALVNVAYEKYKASLK